MRMTTICFVILCSVTLLRGASLRGVIYRYARDANTRAVNIDRRPVPTREPIAPITFLEKYGYLDELNTTEQVSHSPADRERGIREFQSFHQLPITGRLDGRTLTKMQQPRCGLPDVVRPSARRNNRNSPLAFYTPGYKWQRNNIKWKIVGTTGQLTRSQQRSSYARAFRKWVAVSPLQIRETAGAADIEIKFVRGNHYDGSPLDGRGGTLAHAFFPGSAPISGDTHFDEDEQWTMRGSVGTNLEIVAAHEFGHALGIGHSNVPGALMAPFYKYDANYRLHSDDIRAIQSLYGSRQTPAVRPTRPPRRTTRRPRPTRPPRRTTRRPRPTRPRPTRPRTTRRPRVTTRMPRPPTSRCNLRFDAIIQAHDGNTYFTRLTQIYKLNPNGGIEPGYPRRVKQVYSRAPINVASATYSRQARKTYMFKGRRIWRYTGYNLDPGYPKTIQDPRFPTSPMAALSWRDYQIYLFKGSQFWAFNTRTETVNPGYPLQAAPYWRNVPSNVEAAVRWRDGYTYFFKGVNYFKFHDYSRIVEEGYPKRKAPAWLGCGQRVPK